MFGSRVRRFLDAWRDADRETRLFLLWSASNTVVAFGLIVSALGLLVVTNAPGFQRTVLFGYVAVAVAWTLSIFLVGPAYERLVDPAE